MSEPTRERLRMAKIREYVKSFRAQSLANGEITVSYTATQEPWDKNCSAYGVMTRMSIASWVEVELNKLVEAGTDFCEEEE